ncbi:MAG: PepSY domain-containing protein [Alphaproteobacteria bacterium]
MRRLLLLLACLTAFALPVSAGQEDARRAVRSGEARPLAEILSDLKGRYPGRVLDADIADRGGGDWTYGIRLLDPRGRVVELDVDARSGQVLRERGGGGGRDNQRDNRLGNPVAPGFAPQSGPGWNRGDPRRDAHRGRDERGAGRRVEPDRRQPAEGRIDRGGGNARDNRIGDRRYDGRRDEGRRDEGRRGRPPERARRGQDEDEPRGRGRGRD